MISPASEKPGYMLLLLLLLLLETRDLRLSSIKTIKINVINRGFDV